ncbi:unnamed protein product, partial [Rotaria magnacalcarata]
VQEDESCSSPIARNEAVAPVPFSDQGKKQGGFQLPVLLSFDNTMDKIKDTLGIDSKKKEDGTKLTDTVVPTTATGTTEAVTAEKTPKNESGFQLPALLSFDNTMDKIKDSLGIDSKKKEDGTKFTDTVVPTTATGTTEAVTSEKAPRKESGFQLPVLHSFDNTMDKIKDTLGFDSKKKGDAAKTDGTVLPTTIITTTDFTAADKTPKNESGFQLPVFLSFDNTMDKIKDSLGTDSKKKDETTKFGDTEVSAAGIGTTEAVAAEKAPTKNEVVLPSPKSFIGRTIAEIKEVLHIDTPEAKDKSDQEQESASFDKMMEKSVSGFHSIGISSPQRTSEKSKESSAMVAEKDNTSNQSNLDSTVATKGIVDAEASNNRPKKQTGIQPFIIPSLDNRDAESKGVGITDATKNKEFSDKEIPSLVNKIIQTTELASVAVKPHSDVESTRSKAFSFDDTSGSISDDHPLDSTQNSGVIKRQGLESPNVQKGLSTSATPTPTPTKTGKKLFRIPSMESIVAKVKEVISADAEKKDAARKEDELS